MPLLNGKILQDVVKLFKTRGLFFYHACQLIDFDTYVKLGGIPSRNLMAQSGLPYTRFDTDAKDQTNGVWPKIFGNLSDFGHGFAMGQWSEGSAPTPNPYGPILLVANPDILLNAADVAVCLRSAGGRNFNREDESLSSADEINRLFIYPSNDPKKQRRSYIKYSNELKQEFGKRYAATNNEPLTYNPEISCTVRYECLPFNHLSHIVVDRYYGKKISLSSQVRDIALSGRLHVEIRERSYINGRRDILSDLYRVLRNGMVEANQLETMVDVSPSTREWVKRLLNSRLEWLYFRFAKYLKNGSIAFIS